MFAVLQIREKKVPPLRILKVKKHFNLRPATEKSNFFQGERIQAQSVAKRKLPPSKFGRRFEKIVRNFGVFYERGDTRKTLKIDL